MKTKWFIILLLLAFGADLVAAAERKRPVRRRKVYTYDKQVNWANSTTEETEVPPEEPAERPEQPKSGLNDSWSNPSSGMIAPTFTAFRPITRPTDDENKKDNWLVDGFKELQNKDKEETDNPLGKKEKTDSVWSLNKDDSYASKSSDYEQQSTDYSNYNNSYRDSYATGTTAEKSSNNNYGNDSKTTSEYTKQTQNGFGDSWKPAIERETASSSSWKSNLSQSATEIERQRRAGIGDFKKDESLLSSTSSFGSGVGSTGSKNWKTASASSSSSSSRGWQNSSWKVGEMSSYGNNRGWSDKKTTGKTSTISKPTTSWTTNLSKTPQTTNFSSANSSFSKPAFTAPAVQQKMKTFGDQDRRAAFQ